MNRKLLAGLAAGALFAVAAPLIAQEKGGLDQTGPYEPVAGWFKPGISVTIDNPNRMILTVSDQKLTQPNAPMLSADGKVLAERSQASKQPPESQPHLNQVLVVNAEGKVIDNWAQWNNEFVLPHNA